MNLVTTLPLLATNLESFDDINYGGCGVVAAHVGKRLQHIVPTQIAVYNSKKIDADKIRAQIKNPRSSKEWCDNGMEFGHLLVLFEYKGKQYLFDTDGVQKFTNTLRYGETYVMHLSGLISVDEAAAWAANPYGWNWQFNRNHIPAIKQRIARFFIKHIN